jgi:hypothetical protein
MPRAKAPVRLFGLEIDAEYVRQATWGLVTVALIVAIGVGIEEVRLRRLETTAVAREAAVRAGASERTAIKHLALDVARYQEFAREADAYHSSGSLAALTVARIGNTVPAAVWLETLDHDSDGYTLTGGSESVESLSGTMLSLGKALPQSNASLLNIDNHPANPASVRFRAHVGVPADILP